MKTKFLNAYLSESSGTFRVSCADLAVLVGTLDLGSFDEFTQAVNQEMLFRDKSYRIAMTNELRRLANLIEKRDLK